MMADFAARHPKAVEKLVLVAPAIGASAIPDQCSRLIGAGAAPMLLLWAADDNVIPFGNSALWVRECAPHVTFRSIEQGGHRIVAEAYDTAIYSFLQGTAVPPSPLVRQRSADAEYLVVERSDHG